MPVRPVVVAPPSASKRLPAWRLFWVVALIGVAAPWGWAETAVPVAPLESYGPLDPAFSLPLADGYLARLDEASPEGLRSALLRAEMLFMAGRLKGALPPASFVLHGPEVAVFFRDNYQQHKPLVDLAARLSAFGVISIQVCETRTGVLGRDRNDLLPFVGTVPFGPVEEQRLIQQERYVYF